MTTHGSRGYTLLEILITLTIAAILCNLSIGGFGALVQKSQRRNAIQDTTSSINRARHLAVTRGERVALCNIDAEGACKSEWTGDYLAAFIDANRNRIRENDEEIVYQQPWNASAIHASWINHLGDQTITYQSNGRIVSNGTLYLRDANNHLFAKLIVNNSGRFRLEEL